MENVQVIFERDPTGRRVEASDFRVTSAPFTQPDPLEPGTLVVRNLYFSLDPYMRGRMNTQAKSYFPPFVLGQPIETMVVGEVIDGQRDGIEKGDTVAAFARCEKFSVLPPSAMAKKLPADQPFSPTVFLGLLGATGATAYHGLSLCNPKPGQTIFVSGAAGAVGLAVGQMAKLKGMTVIGSAGTDEKVQLLTEKFGFDKAFNYRSVAGRIQEVLQDLAPEGLDAYFDNVGSEHLDAALGCLKPHGFVVACGMISLYNGETYAYKNMTSIVFKELKVEGFIISAQLQDPEFLGRFTADVGMWLAEGKILAPEHIVEGIENTPEAFLGLFSGVNVGKLVVKV